LSDRPGCLPTHHPPPFDLATLSGFFNAQAINTNMRAPQFLNPTARTYYRKIAQLITITDENARLVASNNEAEDVEDELAKFGG